MGLPENQGESQKQRSELFKACPLETLELTGCQLRDEGMQTIFQVLAAHPVIFQNLRNLKMTSNRMTEYSLQNILAFAKNFQNKKRASEFAQQGYANYNPKQLYILMRKQDVKQLPVYRDLRK